MNIIFHNSGELEGDLILELLEEDYIPQRDMAIQKYRANIDLKGFRKGQAPYSIIKKRYGSEILAQTVIEIARDTLQNYIQEQKLNLWGNPLMVEDTLYGSNVNINNPGTLQLKFKYGLVPEVDLVKLQEIKLDKYEIKNLTETTINQALRKARLHYGTTLEVTKSMSGDKLFGLLTNGNDVQEQVYFPADIKIEQNPVNFLDLNLQDSIQLQLRPNQPYTLPHKDDSDEKALELLKSLSGQYQFTVEKIYRPIPAELNQEFFSKILGENRVSSIEEFKEQFKNVLINHTQMMADSLLRSNIKQAVLSHLTFELPQNFIKQQLKISHPEWDGALADNFYNYTQPTLRWNLIIDKIGKENNVRVSIEEITKILKIKLRDTLAKDQLESTDEETLKKIVEKIFADRGENLPYKEAYSWILEQKVLEILKDKINIHTQQKSVEEFNQILADIDQGSEDFQPTFVER